MFEYNGQSFGYSRKTCTLTLPQDGSLPITALSIYPLKFHPKHEELKKALEDRGSKYAQIVRRAPMNYE